MKQKAILKSLNRKEDILPEYRDSPIEKLIEYKNFNRPFDHYDSAQLLIVMCMDNRKKFILPDNFAYIVRTGGANIQGREFYLSYALAIAGIRHITIIGHDNCGMAGLDQKKDAFIQGLVDLGWAKDKAIAHFEEDAPHFGIDQEENFILDETKRLNELYPQVNVAPLLYKLEDKKLYQIVST